MYSIFKNFIFLLLLLFIIGEALAAPLKNVPVTLKQPDGKIINIFTSGDETYNWLHDKDNFTIIRNSSGYYVYAVKEGEKLNPSGYIVGTMDPKHTNLIAGINYSENRIPDKSKSILKVDKISSDKKLLSPNSGGFANLVLFIRFSDDNDFDDSILKYDSIFNNEMSPSVNNYYNEVSYGQLNIKSQFIGSSSVIISYKDSHPRGYYQPYDEKTNLIGYRSSFEEETTRENELLKNAINYFSSKIPSNMNIDMDNNGYVDNICFIISGNVESNNRILWPHQYSLASQNIQINGKLASSYNLQFEKYLYVNVLCHEIFHALGAPDLYRYMNTNITPIGQWDIMAGGSGHMSAYMKYKYGKWIPKIDVIKNTGTYALNPLISTSGNCYMIKSLKNESEYFFLEYRKKTGKYEIDLPGSGLLIYRVNGDFWGNENGPPDEIYLYRPDGTSNNNGNLSKAYFCSNDGRIIFNESTNPSCLFSDGSPGDLDITDVGAAGETISFSVKMAPLAAIKSPTAVFLIGTEALLGATITSDGGNDVIERGIVLSFSPNPTINNNYRKIISPGTIGTFKVKTGQFADGTLYHFRGYVTTSIGTNYTDDSSFIYKTKDCEKTLLGHSFGVNSVCFSPDGNLLASGSYGYDQTIKVWNLSGDSLEYTKSVYLVNSICFSPDGKKLAVSSGYDICILKADDGSLDKILKGHTGTVNSIAYSKDGSRLVSCSDDKTIKLWNSVDGALISTIYGHNSPVRSVNFSSDGAKIISGGDDYQTNIWNTNSSSLILSVSRMNGSVISTCFSPDGNYSALGGINRVELFNSYNGVPVWRKMEYSLYSYVCFSPDGGTLAIAGGSRIIFYNMGGSELYSLYGHSNTIKSLCYSPDGAKLASGSLDKTIKIWSVKENLNAVSEINQLPASYTLSQNYPNPFNPSTKISYSIPEKGNVKLSVYSLLGQEVETLVDELKNPGNYTISWNASKYSSGIYFYTLSSGNFVKTKKMLLIK